MIAGVAMAVRRSGAPGTTVAECRRLTATALADLHEVRCRNPTPTQPQLSP